LVDLAIEDLDLRRSASSTANAAQNASNDDPPTT
jgi:hypothetical protein